MSKKQSQKGLLKTNLKDETWAKTRFQNNKSDGFFLFRKTRFHNYRILMMLMVAEQLPVIRSLALA